MKVINQITLVLTFFLVSILLGCREDPVTLEFYGHLRGQVSSEASEPLEEVTITTNPATLVATTAADGTFSMDSIPVGNYVVRARLSGFKEELANIEIKEDRATELSLVMSEAPDDNASPVKPSQPNPENGAQEVGLSVQLSWSATDPDEGDSLLFNLLFFEAGSSPEEPIATDLQDTFFSLEKLSYGTSYYWQVISNDGHNEPVLSEVWNFTTLPFPENRIHYAALSGGKYILYSSDLAGNSIAITAPQDNCWRPRLSPGRDLLAYLSIHELETHLFVMHPDGSNARQITADVPLSAYDNYKMNYCWSPDGAQLLFMDHRRLYKINRDGSGLALAAEAPLGQAFTEVDWSAQNDQLVALTVGDYPYESQLYLILENGEMQAILTGLEGVVSSPSFSVDGNQVLFSRDASAFQSPDGRQLDARLYLFSLYDGGLQDISTEKDAGTNDLEPRFSPTGAQIIFTNTPNDGISKKSIWISDITGDNREMLYDNAEMPDWR